MQRLKYSQPFLSTGYWKEISSIPQTCQIKQSTIQNKPEYKIRFVGDAPIRKSQNPTDT